MKRFFLLILSLACFSTGAGEPKILKVLPQLVDRDGHASTSPSLYERDAYQAFLRKHPEEVSGLRFHVHWKAPDNPKDLRLRVEVRGSKPDLPTPIKSEMAVKRGFFSRTWSSLVLSPQVLAEAGDITAWRVTLWEGDTELAEQKSFLWAPR